VDLTAFQAIYYLVVDSAACCAVADSCVSKFITRAQGDVSSSGFVVES